MSKEMKDIFEKLPMGDKAPQGLRNWTEFTSRQPRGKSWFDKRFKWAFGGVAAAGLVVATVMVLTPRQAEAKTWDLISDAYDDITSVYIEMSVTEDDKNVNMFFAMKGDRWHVSVDGEVDVSYQGGEVLFWKHGDDTAMQIQMPFDIKIPANVFVKHLKFTEIMEQKMDDADVDISPTKVRDGRKVYDVVVRDGSMVAYLTIDAISDLPLDVNVTKDGVTEAKLKFRFNEDVDDSLLSPVLPSGIKFKVMNFADMQDHGSDFNPFGHDDDFDPFDHDDDDDEKIERPDAPTAA